MQVDPIKHTLKAPGTKRLKLKCDEPLSDFAFNLNLRRYILSSLSSFMSIAVLLFLFLIVFAIVGRGLHSSTSQLNLSGI